MKFDLKGKRVWVAGHRGMVGSAIVRALKERDVEVQTVDRQGLDLRRAADVEAWVARHRPDLVFLAAAKVGGILANDTFPADFLYDNLAIELAVIGAAAKHRVEKLVVLGSTCIYPRMAAQPIKEEALLTGPLEPTNEWYAIAKIAGLKLAEAFRRQYGFDFISLMPTNLYGPGDNFSLTTSHVIPALFRKAHEAKLMGKPSVEVWGTGTPRREFLYVDDLAEATLFLAETYSEASHVNVGTGEDITIGDLARLVCDVAGFTGPLAFDTSRPDGMPLKRIDVSRLVGLGWKAKTDLRSGLERTYRWFLDNEGNRRQ